MKKFLFKECHIFCQLRGIFEGVSLWFWQHIMECIAYNYKSLKINPKHPDFCGNPSQELWFMPLFPSSVIGNASWKGISEQTWVLRLCKVTPTEATGNFGCFQDQNTRLKVESCVIEISGGPWNLRFIITGFRQRSVRTLSSVWQALGKCIPQSHTEVK